MTTIDDLRGGLIVSVQAWPGSAIDDPYVLAAIAAAAQSNGAVAVRIQGVPNMLAVRARVTVPIIGLIKQTYDGFEPYITPTALEAIEIVACGAEVVALDATARPRPRGERLIEIIDAIHQAGRLAMADCSTVEDARAAREAGADMVASTLCGYTVETKGCSLPALDLIADMARLGTFVIAEGGVREPAHVAQAFAAGANAVVVGTAITNVDALVREFAARATKSMHR